MTSYDDHDYCLTCDKHTVRCYCFAFNPPSRDDEDDRDHLCWTPDEEHAV